MSDSRAIRRFFANLLMAVGGLITVLCGGCTVFFLGAIILESVQSGGLSRGSGGLAPGIGATAIVVGGLPTAVGVALYLWGRRMKRRVEAQIGENPENT